MSILKLDVPIDIYDGPEGKEKLIKKDVITTLYIDSDLVLSHQEILNSRGTVSKNKCKIFIRDVGPMIVKHSVEYFNRIKQQRTPIGFLRGIKTKEIKNINEKRKSKRTK